jgi:hypothetical protein
MRFSNSLRTRSILSALSVTALVGASALSTGCMQMLAAAGAQPAASATPAPTAPTAATSDAPTPTDAASKPAAAPAVARTPPEPVTGAPDLRSVFGAPDDGWSPKLIDALKAGMSPDDAGKAFAGAEKTSKYGFSDVTVKGVDGVTALRFYFKKEDDKFLLRSVTLKFTKTQTSKEFFGYLAKLSAYKFGQDPKQSDVDEQIVTFIDDKFHMAQLGKVPGQKSFQLEVTLK